MNRIVEQDILMVEEGVICHQVNCLGVMGAGLAKEVRKKWPKVFQEYRRTFLARGLYLGLAQMVEVGPRLWVVNVCGQYGFGHERRFTNYVALESGLRSALLFSRMERLQMFVPYGIGCGLAGGDWARVRQILYNISSEIIICKKPRSRLEK